MILLSFSTVIAKIEKVRENLKMKKVQV